MNGSFKSWLGIATTAAVMAVASAGFADDPAAPAPGTMPSGGGMMQHGMMGGDQQNGATPGGKGMMQGGMMQGGMMRGMMMDEMMMNQIMMNQVMIMHQLMMMDEMMMKQMGGMMHMHPEMMPHGGMEGHPPPEPAH